MTATVRGGLATVLLGSIAVVGGALLFQYVGGLTPCELCLYERWPYYAAIPLGLASLAVAGRRAGAISGAALLLLVFLASSALAFYHVGVELKWFAGPAACTGPVSAARTVAELKAQLLGQKPVRCDEPQWILFGISLAGWNFLASLALVGIALNTLRAAVRGERR